MNQRNRMLILFMQLAIFPVAMVPGIECGSEEFECSDGTNCVSRYEFCDGYRNCRDGSDEIRYHRNSTMSGIPCRPDRYNCLLPESQASRKTVLCRKTIECSNDEFACVDGSGCLPWHFYCSGHAECLDGSDEIRRSLNSTLIISGVPCRNGGYICVLPESQKEKKSVLCTEKSLKCEIEEFECLDGSGCLPVYEFCNGVTDCSDGSDEITFHWISNLRGIKCRRDRRICVLPESQLPKRRFFCKKSLKCTLDEFACTDGSGCLPVNDFCDGYVHCRDGSDEIPPNPQSGPNTKEILCRQDKDVCMLPHAQESKKDIFCKKNPECDIDEFLCRDGTRCLPANYFCDGESHCDDNSDAVLTELDQTLTGLPCRWESYICLLPEDQTWKKEHLCIKDHECDKDEFMCSDGSQCIPTFSFCDGKEHCGDGSDEIKHSLQSNSPARGIPCRREQQICLLPTEQESKKGYFCKKSLKCNKREFACVDGTRCLPLNVFCNGKAECSDGSDNVRPVIKLAKRGITCLSGRHSCLLPKKQAWKKEVLCTGNLKCSRNEFTCSDGSWCIPKQYFCDGVKHCRDGSDEVGLKSAPIVRGIRCRRGRKICILPRNQASKNTVLCSMKRV